MFGYDCGEGFINTVAQLDHGFSELSCSKRFQSNLKRCNHCWSLKKQMSYLAGFGNVNTVFEIDVHW